MVLSILIGLDCHAQPQFSIATDLSVLRSLKKNQRFWGVGQTVHAHFHLTKKEGAYFNFSYYTPGKFSNNFVATAKSPLTSPQQVSFSSRAEVRFRHLSVGWKHYFLGDYASTRWNFYGNAGFGLLFGAASNIYSRTIDTSLYDVPGAPVNGSGNFKRLTLDLAAGMEIPISMDIFFYLEGRTWIPTSDYPSKYLFVNDKAPLSASISGGVRILFD